MSLSDDLCTLHPTYWHADKAKYVFKESFNINCISSHNPLKYIKRWTLRKYTICKILHNSRIVSCNSQELHFPSPDSSITFHGRKTTTGAVETLPAGGCPALVSIFSLGGDDMAGVEWCQTLLPKTRLLQNKNNPSVILPQKQRTLLTTPSTWLFPAHCLATVRDDVTKPLRPIGALDEKLRPASLLWEAVGTFGESDRITRLWKGSGLETLFKNSGWREIWTFTTINDRCRF